MPRTEFVHPESGIEHPGVFSSKFKSGQLVSQFNGEMKMLRAIVAGAAGRMGVRIISMIHQTPEITLAAAFERPDHPNLGEDAGQVAGLGELGVKIRGSIKEVINQGEVVIDFTTPEATL